MPSVRRLRLRVHCPPALHGEPQKGHSKKRWGTDDPPLVTAEISGVVVICFPPGLLKIAVEAPQGTLGVPTYYKINATAIVGYHMTEEAARQVSGLPATVHFDALDANRVVLGSAEATILMLPGDGVVEDASANIYLPEDAIKRVDRVEARWKYGM